MAKGRQFSIDTSPTKRVVVDSLTRDAPIEACIFDLIDNSVDAARDTALSRLDTTEPDTLVDDYTGFNITLKIHGKGLEISDNCGGITIEKLRTMVLRFGQRSSHNTGIGVFGVGLNRALFRIGSTTHLRTDTGVERAELVLNVEDYIKSDDWTLPAESFASTGIVGTSIEIGKLNAELSQLFAGDDFQARVLAETGVRYARFIQKGLEITVNGVTIDPNEVAIRENSPFELGLVPKFFHVDGVSVYVRYGQHDRHRFTIEQDYNKDVNKDLTAEYGWSIICNDRTVLLSNHDYRTGWDSFHSEFYGFVGTVEFVSSDPSKLPWTTTKDDVDLNSSVYRRALEEMRAAAKKWRTFADERKKKASRGETLPFIPPAGKPTVTASPEQVAGTGKKPPSPKRTPVKKVVKRVNHNELRELLPPDIDEANCDDKLLALVHEGKGLDLGTHPYAALALIRMLFETAANCHAVRHSYADAMKNAAVAARKAKGVNMKAAEEKRAVPSFDEALDFLDDNHAVWGAIKATQLKHCIGQVRNRKPIMNGALHNAWQTIDRSTVFQIRTELLPMLRHLIEN